MRPDIGNYWGNAKYWAGKAQAAGFAVDGNAQVGDIVVFQPGQDYAGDAGHVAYVANVYNGGKTMDIREDNFGSQTENGTWRYGLSTAGLSFIHGGQALSASNDGQFFPTTIVAGGPGASFGFNVRFNEPFKGSFILRPNTPASVSRLASPSGDFGADIAPNDDHVGYYRGTVHASIDTPPGQYFLQWNVLDSQSGQLTTLQPSFVVTVKPAWYAQFVAEQYPGAMTPGQTGTAKLTFRNSGSQTLHRGGTNPTRCRGSNPRDRVSQWIDQSNANVIAGGEGVKIDQDTVAPGQTFTCTLPLKAPATYGAYREYFSPVTEGKGWMLDQDDVWLPLSVADNQHVVWPATDYGARLDHIDYPSALPQGGTGTLKLYFKNTGVATPLQQRDQSNGLPREQPGRPAFPVGRQLRTECDWRPRDRDRPDKRCPRRRVLLHHPD